jgi:hypothetical protein
MSRPSPPHSPVRQSRPQGLFGQLILKRASTSRSSGEWNDDVTCSARARPFHKLAVSECQGAAHHVAGECGRHQRRSIRLLRKTRQPSEAAYIVLNRGG